MRSRRVPGAGNARPARRFEYSDREMAEPEAAVAILHTAGADPRVLLIRRAERTGDSWSGHWSFPGGRRDPRDPDLLHTALRELAEECGIHLGPADMEAGLPHMLARRTVGPFLLVAPFLFAVDSELPAAPDPCEVAQSLWIPMSFLRDPGNHRLLAAPGQPDNLLFPAVELAGGPLWGFTYRLITAWLGLSPAEGRIERPGFDAACRLLDFLLSQGLTLEHGWEEQPGTAGPSAVKAAAVNGAIPVPLAIAHLSRPGSGIPQVNLVEVRPDCIRVAGLAFEQYCIYAAG